MKEFLAQLQLNQLNEASIVLRVVLAAVLSGVLGLERTRKRRAAGFRTYILVCLGAAIAVMTGEYLTQRFPGVDPSRLAAQVISGIGFLGAGTIIMTASRQVRGLTTAAGLWASACMGIAIGAGFYFGAIAVFLMMVLVMTIFEYVQNSYIARAKRIQVYAVFESLDNINDFMHLAVEKGFQVDDFQTCRPDSGFGIGVVFMLSFPKRVSHAEVLTLVKDCNGIKFLEEI